MKKEKGKIISVVSSKGGVGKSILLLNLAGVYSSLGKKVLILDFDFSNGTVALNLNLEPKRTIYQLTDDIYNHRYLSYKDYLISYNDDIDIIAAPKDPRQAMKIDSKHLVSLLDEVGYSYDVVLVDTTHGLTKNNIFTLDHSNTILYVISNDFMDIKNSKNFMAIMKDAEFTNIKIVLNQSHHTSEEYFSNFDIKSIIKKNIDYTISSSFHVNNITRYILEGQIITLNSNFINKNKKDMNKLTNMAEDLIQE